MCGGQEGNHLVCDVNCSEDMQPCCRASWR